MMESQKNNKNYIGELNTYQQTNSIHCTFLEAEKSGPDHNPKFLRACVCNGQRVTGNGPNKQSAKNDAARRMLEFLKEQKPKQAFDSRPNMNYSHTENSTSGLNDKNYISTLNELSQRDGHQIDYDEREINSTTEGRKFYTGCKFKDQVTSGYGITKKVSKQEASRKMLQLLGINHRRNDISSSNSRDGTDLSAEEAPDKSSSSYHQVNDEKLLLEAHIAELEEKLQEQEKSSKRIHKELRDKIKRLEVDLKERDQKLDVMGKVGVDFVSRFVEDFEQASYLGHGGFAVVFKAKNKIDDFYYAIKRIPLPRCEKAKQKMLKEVKTLAKLEHNSIVRYYTAWWEAPPKDWQVCSDESRFKKSINDSTQSWIGPADWEVSEEFSSSNGSQSEIAYFGPCCREGSDCLKRPPLYLYIQMELCEKTLRGWLNDRDKVTPESIKIFVQIVGAVAFCHEKKMIHRDLKPGNIFLTSNLEIKIGDFGLATDAVRMLETSSGRRWTKKSKHTGGIGTELYQAPEQAKNIYNKQVDIYALGIIFLELFYQMDTAFERNKVISELKKSGTVPKTLSESKKKFIKLLMSKDPTNRPFAEEIQKTREFKSVSEEYGSSPNTSRQ